MSEEKPESKPEPKSLREQLKELRAQRLFQISHWKMQRVEMESGRKQSLTESLSERNKSLEGLKAAKNKSKDMARSNYTVQISEATRLRDLKILTAKAEYEKLDLQLSSTREEAYQAAHQEFNQQSAPLLDAHKQNCEGLEADFIKEMRDIDKSEAKELAGLDEQIKVLEAKVEPKHGVGQAVARAET